MDDGIYPRGAVKRIKLTNFVGTVVIEAGSRVNLVEGANGSGKSSLVTALCMGLGGSIKSLGRQKRPDELIRRGCTAFELEITLSGGPGEQDVIVHRRTELASGASRGRKRKRGGGGRGGSAAGAAAGEDGSDDGDVAEGSDEDSDGAQVMGGGSGGRRGHHTTWQINGLVVTEARVKDQSRGMGIHFDNLCQFLPQERVQEFSNLGPTELLEGTEEAIGDGHLLVRHKELKQRSAALKAKREELQRTQERLARVEAEQQAAGPEYQRLQKRNALRKQVEQLRRKGMWLEKERCAAALARAQAQVQAARGKVDEARGRLQQAQAPLNHRRRAHQAAEQAVGSQRRDARALEAEVGRGLEGLRRQEQQLKTKEEELEGLKTRSDRWRVEVRRTREELNRVRAERAGLDVSLDPVKAARLAAIDLEIQQAAEEVGPLERQLQHKQQEMANLSAQIRALEAAGQRRQDQLEQRLRRLERVLPLSRRLHEWLHEMRSAGHFRRRVLGPVLLEITAVQDPVWAAQLEFQLTRNYLGAVIVEHEEDNNLVNEWLHSNKAGVRDVNKVLWLKRVPGPVTYPYGEARLYGRYGITHTVDQIFEASSELVKQALCVSSNINMAYVGSEQTNHPAVMNALLRETPVRRILTPSQVTTASESVYDPGHISQTVTDLRGASLLDDSAVQGDEAAEQQQLMARRQALDSAKAEAQNLSDSIQQRREAVRDLQAEKQRLQNEKRRVEKSLMDASHRESELARRLDRLQHQGDPMAAADAIRSALCHEAEALLGQARAIAEKIARQHAELRKLAAQELSLAATAATLAPLQQAVRRAEEGVRGAERDAEAAAEREARERDRLQEAEAALNEELGGRGPDAALRAAWTQWPDDAEELEQLLAAKQAEVDQAQAALRGDEAAVLEAWGRRDREIKELRQRDTAGSKEVQDLVADVEARKAAWLPELKRHMEAINEAVKGHFKAIGCAGEVVLKEEGDAFEQYAAEIQVQYRPDEPLRPLNRNHHSGGERSVATMLYLMALQGVTTTPFRVVDEINQGMDSRNERKVFNLLVECSSRPDTPQCFLLTPKLTANLRFNDHVQVLSLKVTPAMGMDASAAVKTQLMEAATEGQGVAAAKSAAGSSRQRQLRPAGTGLAQMPWQPVKSLILYGRRATAGRD